MFDLVVVDDVRVAAGGLLDVSTDGRSELRVSPSWNRPGLKGIEGGRVSVLFQETAEAIDALTPDDPVAVEGLWRNGEIVDARIAAGDTAPMIIRSPRDRPAASTLSPEQCSAVLEEARVQAGGTLLAAGGSRDVLSVQILFVTAEFAQWYETLEAVKLDVFVSVYPSESDK